MATVENVHANDVLPVRSRISWGAIFAGAFVALAVYVLLSVLGTALGLSVMDRTDRDTLATGGAIWAIVSMLLALFAGGCVTTRFTAGENKTEAVIYGAILWGVMFAMILVVTGRVLSAGFGAMLGTSNFSAAERPVNWEQVGRDAGLNQGQVDRLRAAMPSAAELRERSDEMAWWSLAGVLLSMLAAIGGALAGSGPTPLLGATLFRRTTVQVHGGGAAPAR